MTPLFATHKLTRSTSSPELTTKPAQVSPPPSTLQRSSSFSDTDRFDRTPTPTLFSSTPQVATQPITAPTQPQGLPFGSVSASSAHHDLKLMKQKAPSAAAKPYGFSFVDKNNEKTDVTDINKYIKHVNSGGTTPFNGTDGKAITHKKADHGGAKDGMMQFHVNGRTYSTHAETTQLFPVEGTGIVRGKGVQDMHRELKAQGIYGKTTDVKTYYAVDTALDDNAKSWNTAGKVVQGNAQKSFNAFMGFK